MIPVTILTGFLGAGKTTLLNRILTAPSHKRIAVVVNEFGDIGIDDQFIARRSDDIIELTNGCVCCSARNDTMEILLALAQKARQGVPIDQVIIETTGLAKPAALARFFLGGAPLQAHFNLDGIVTVVDAFFGVSQFVQYPEVKEQIGVADIVLINKIDLAQETQIAHLESWIRGINPTAQIVRCSSGDVPIEKLLGIGGFGADVQIQDEHSSASSEQADHIHDRDITSVSIRESSPLDRGKFLRWLHEFVAMEGGDLLRYKGVILFSGAKERAILQGVHMINEISSGGSWPDGIHQETMLVFIGRRLMEDVIREGIMGCIAK